MMLRPLTLCLVLFSTSIAFSQVPNPEEPNLSDVMTALNAIDGKLTDLGNRISKNENDIKDITDRLNEMEERQLQILTANESGGFRLNLPGQMANEDFQREFGDAIDDTIRKKVGTLTITNKMSSYQRVLVNRAEYGLRPSEKVEIKLPAGTVTTELPGIEGVKTWMIGSPDYSQSIDIVPARNSSVSTFFRGPASNSTVTDVQVHEVRYAAPVEVHYAPPVYVERPVPVEQVYVASPVVVNPPIVVHRPVLPVGPPLLLYR